MIEFFHTFLYAISRNFGALCAIALAIFLCIGYARGELDSLFTFLKQTLSTRKPDGTWEPSTKNMGYFLGAATLCWSFVKVTLAVCRRIDQQTTPPTALDPTWIFIVELAVIATLVGAGYLFGKLIAGRFSGIVDPPPPPEPKPNEPTQGAQP